MNQQITGNAQNVFCNPETSPQTYNLYMKLYKAETMELMHAIFLWSKKKWLQKLKVLQKTGTPSFWVFPVTTGLAMLLKHSLWLSLLALLFYISESKPGHFRVIESVERTVMRLAQSFPNPSNWILGDFRGCKKKNPCKHGYCCFKIHTTLK